MTTRAHSDLMLVGSFPAESAEEAMRLAAPLFGDCCFGLPDSETGDRAIDGEDGLRIRTETARRHLRDFGIANYCGFARQPGLSAEATLREHRALVDVFRSLPS